MAAFQRHTRCDKCGSSDGKALYDDGSAYCFACRALFPTDGEPVEEQEAPQNKRAFLRGHSPELTKRGIKKETTEHWKYEVGEDEYGNRVQIANYFDDRRRLTSQKLRSPDKDFSIVGDGKDMPLYGQWFPIRGKSVTITEGEIDALSVSQAMELKWNVVSLPNGAQSAVKAITRAYDWLDQFETIVLMFDMDDPGQEAAAEVAEILPPGKVKIAKLPCKDANETLTEKGPGEIVSAFWRAEVWRPDGIISGAELTKARLKKACAVGYKLPYPILDKEMLGLRKGELTLLTAGSGIGKSTLRVSWPTSSIRSTAHDRQRVPGRGRREDRAGLCGHPQQRPARAARHDPTSSVR
jgi:twinkle protein